MHRYAIRTRVQRMADIELCTRQVRNRQTLALVTVVRGLYATTQMNFFVPILLPCLNVSFSSLVLRVVLRLGISNSRCEGSYSNRTVSRFKP